MPRTKNAKPDEVCYRASTSRKSLATRLESRKATLKQLRAKDQALFVPLTDLSAADMLKIKALVDSLDYEPIFVAHSAATCD
jgi:hypothetical protein